MPTRFQKNAKRNLIIVNLVAIALVFLLAEGFMRLMGWQPGLLFNYTWLKKVDTLKVRPDYFADEFGIQKVTPYAQKKVAEAVQTPLGELNFMGFREGDELLPDMEKLCVDFHILHRNYTAQQIGEAGRRYGIDEESLKVMQQHLANSEFFQKIAQLQQAKQLSSFEQALLNYSASPINADGFRSIAFEQYDTVQTKVLLLGDSFTWGRSAEPLFNSYADILLARNWVVYNTGIVCTDPAQYADIAHRYIPALLPDVVCINYYAGNDDMYLPRETEARKPAFHFTNAGLFYAQPLGYYMPPKEAYAYYLNTISLPEADDKLVNGFFAATVLGSRFWHFMETKGWVNSHNSANDAFLERAIQPLEKPVSGRYIEHIAEICEQNGAKLLLNIIPVYLDLNKGGVAYDSISVDEKFYGEVFGDIPFDYPRNLTPGDYVGMGDDHFNTSGAKKYADFLERRIKETVKVRE